MLAAIAFGITAGVASAQPDASRVPRLVFPIIGPVQYTDDFGAPRGQGPHQGNDILAPRKAIALAAESGKLKFWSHGSAGCMLYLNGDSGTQYLYIHLNNDLKGDDGKGKCEPGVSYWPGLKDGAKVKAGQAIAYVGDSGDAEAAGPHLHFEVHPGGQSAVSPYKYLQAAQKLYFPVNPAKLFTASFRGTVVKASGGALKLNVKRVQTWPGSIKVPNVNRVFDLRVPPETVVFDPVGAIMELARLEAATPGQLAVAFTRKAKPTLEAAVGEPFALATKKVELTPVTIPR